MTPPSNYPSVSSAIEWRVMGALTFVAVCAGSCTSADDGTPIAPSGGAGTAMLVGTGGDSSGSGAGQGGSANGGGSAGTGGAGDVGGSSNGGSAGSPQGGGQAGTSMPARDAGSNVAKDAAGEATAAGVWGKACVDQRLPGLQWNGQGDPHQVCVDRVNAFRAELGLAPLTRWTAGEGCADATAKLSHDTGQAHPNPAPPECNGLGSSAQNSCPGYASTEQTLELCMAQMWCEGPSPSGKWDTAHGHHMNMAGGAKQLACGFFTADGKTWMIQNLK